MRIADVHALLSVYTLHKAHRAQRLRPARRAWTDPACPGRVPARAAAAAAAGERGCGSPAGWRAAAAATISSIRAASSASVIGSRGASASGAGGIDGSSPGRTGTIIRLNIVIGRFGFPSGRRGRFAGAAAYSSAHSRSVNRAASAGSCDQAASPLPLLPAGSYQTSQAPVMSPARGRPRVLGRQLHSSPPCLQNAPSAGGIQGLNGVLETVLTLARQGRLALTARRHQP